MQMYGCSIPHKLSDVEALLYVQEAQFDKFRQELAATLCLPILLTQANKKIILEEPTREVLEEVTGLVEVMVVVEEELLLEIIQLVNCVASMVTLFPLVGIGLMRISCLRTQQMINLD